MTYQRERVGSRYFTVPTLSKRVKFTVAVIAEKHGYANGERTEWSATVTLTFDGRRLIGDGINTTVDAAQPTGVRLDTATEDQVWSALNLTVFIKDLTDAVAEVGSGPVARVLGFAVLKDDAKAELERYRDFATHIQHMTWVSVPGQTIVAAGDVQADDVVVKRNYYGNIIRYAYVHDINTRDDDDEHVQFVHERDVPHPTSGWYRRDTLLEIIRVR